MSRRQQVQAVAGAMARFLGFCKRVEILRKIWHAGSISMAGWVSSWLLEPWKGIIVFTVVGVVILAEIIRKYANSPLLENLAIYASAAGLALWLSGWCDKPLSDGVIAGGVLAIFCVEALRRYFHASSVLRVFLRVGEESGKRITALDFLVGMLIGYLIFPPEILTVALYITAFCDPAAAFAGQVWGHCHWAGSKKTIEGSVTCFFVAWGITVFFLPLLPPISAVIVGLSAAFAELKTKQRTVEWGRLRFLTAADNFSIVLTAGGVLTTWYCFLGML